MPVVVIASDPITAEGTVAYLRSWPGIMPLAPADLHMASVILVLADRVTEETLVLMRRIATRTARRDIRFVLVCDGRVASRLVRVSSIGLISLISRQGCDHQQIIRAIHKVAEQQLDLPAVTPSEMVRHVHLDGEGPATAPARLQSREIEVLRLIADGLDTVEIARRLSYSERTIKNIIHGLITRLGLRNRPHAVAYALRSGLL